MKSIINVGNKIIVITGGLGQLGRQFSLSLLKNGARVAIFDVNCNNKEYVKERFKTHFEDKNLYFQNVDITSRKSIEKGMIAVKKKWGTPHGLINNAAMDSPPDAPSSENGPFEDYSEKSLDKIMKVNIKGTFLCCQVIGREMAKAGQGSIVNISSIYGIVSPDQRIYEYRRKNNQTFYKPAAYSVTKSALLNLTRYLCTYWAKANVRINTLTLAGVFKNQDKEFLKEYTRKVPLGRMADEDEYNGAVLFLMSDASSYMTGSNLIIDGGFTAW